MSEWGEDPNKWVIQKSSFTDGWMVYAPHDSGGSLHTSFSDAVAVVAGFGADYYSGVPAGYYVQETLDGEFLVPSDHGATT